MKLKEQIQYYLNVRGMTATELSRRSGVPRQNISNWLMNQKPKDVEQVKRVADIFQVSLDHLLFGEPKPMETNKNTYPEFEHLMNGRFEIRIKKIGD